MISVKPSRHTNKVFPSPLAKAAATPTPTVSPAPKTSTSLLRPNTRPATTHFPFPAGHNTAPQPRPHPPCTQPLSQDSLHSPSLSLHLHLPRSSSLSQNPSRPSPTDFSFFFSIVDHNRSSLIGTDRPPSISFTVTCRKTDPRTDPEGKRKLKSTACCVCSFAGNGGCHRRREK